MTAPDDIRPGAWQVLSQELEFETPYIRAHRQVCRTVRGAIVDPYHVFDLPNWAAVLAVTPQGEAVLVRNYRHGAERVMTELPGGIIDAADADPAAAARRELLEETGHAVGTLAALPPIHPYPGRFRQRAFPFVGLDASPVQAQALEDDEDLEVVHVPLAEAMRLFADGSHDVAAAHAGIMLAARYRIETDAALAPLKRFL